MSKFKPTMKQVEQNMLCAVEILDKRPTKAILLNLKGPTREENEIALESLLSRGLLFEDSGRYYLAVTGLNEVMQITGGLRLDSGSNKSDRVNRN